MSRKLLIVNGPNLNLLGEREPEIYGAQTLAELNQWLSEQAPAYDLHFFQSNHETEIIDFLQEHRKNSDGLVINPGGLTHYSVALRDAIVGCQLDAVEVHISDIHKREAFRQVSMIKDVCLEQVSGLGAQGYLEAIRCLEKFWQAQQ